jgi:flagellar motor switch protein FliN/FliY
MSEKDPSVSQSEVELRDYQENDTPPDQPTSSDHETAGHTQDGADGEVLTGSTTRTAADLEGVFDIPVKVSAVLGRASIEVSELLKLDTGTIIELDHKVGEPVDVFVNDRLVARGEVVLVESKLGVTMTEIIKTE